ncbi:MAG: hypothetical protein AAGA56_17525 [Myxococcota bacterium]
MPCYRPALLPFGFVALVLIGGGCGGDDDDSAGRQGPTDAGLPSGDAFLVGTRIRTPDSRSLFLRAFSDLGAAELDLTTAVEIPGQARAFAFGGQVYAADPETLTLRRFAVDGELQLIENDRVSFQGEAVTAFRSTFTIIDERRGVYLDYLGLQAVFFDPSEMIITGRRDLSSLLLRDGFRVAGVAGTVIGEELFAAFAWTADDDAVRTVATLVLPLDDNRPPTVLEDDRCMISGGAFLDEEGEFYVAGDSGDGVYDVFSPVEEPPPCVLRVRDGAFDPDYRVDLRALTGSAHVSGFLGRADRTFVVRTFDSAIDPASFSGPLAFFGAEVWRWHLGRLDGERSRDIGLPLTGISFGPFLVDDSFFIPQLDEETQRTTVFRVTEDGTTEESVRASGDIQVLARIR